YSHSGGCEVTVGVTRGRIGSHRSIQSASWGIVYYELLGAVPEMITKVRIEIAWLRNNFAELTKDSTEKRRVQYTRAYILHIIRGILMLDKSQNLVHLRCLLKLVDFRQASKLS
ncbi:hypothetical protein Gogos_004757, partial [Gossypium gossypioides]|nr:hypothetical protein [Gossypium gossypioides]